MPFNKSDNEVNITDAGDDDDTPYNHDNTIDLTEKGYYILPILNINPSDHSYK